MVANGWLEPDEKEELEAQIMDADADAPFPDVSKYGLSLQDLENVVGQGQVASLQPIGGDDEDEDEREGGGNGDVVHSGGYGTGGVNDYTRFYHDPLWQVAQLRCPQCDHLNSTANGCVCTVCGTIMFGPNDLVDSVNGGLLPDADDVDDVEPDSSDGRPECEYKDGVLKVSVYGIMDETDPESLTQYTEYVICCEWAFPPGHSHHPKKAPTWLVSARFSEYHTMSKALGKRLKPIIPDHLKYPKLTKKGMKLRTKGARKKMRQQELTGYFRKLLDLFQEAKSLLDHIEELDTFLALNLRVTKIKKLLQQKADLKKQREGMSEADSTKDRMQRFVVNALTESQITQASFVIQQFTRLVAASQHDVRTLQPVQQLLRVCLGFLPSLQQSATPGAYAAPELISEAEQCLYELHEACQLYNHISAEFLVGEGGPYGYTQNTV